MKSAMEVVQRAVFQDGRRASQWQDRVHMAGWPLHAYLSQLLQTIPAGLSSIMGVHTAAAAVL